MSKRFGAASDRLLALGFQARNLVVFDIWPSADKKQYCKHNSHVNLDKDQRLKKVIITTWL